MQGIPSYYGADDLMLMSLYDEGCKICNNNKPLPKTADYPSDSFEKKSSVKEKVKKGLTLTGIVAGAGALLWGACKLVAKFKGKK